MEPIKSREQQIAELEALVARLKDDLAEPTRASDKAKETLQALKSKPVRKSDKAE